jgi:putative PIN family toxin of toxin-antitoxin system
MAGIVNRLARLFAFILTEGLCSRLLRRARAGEFVLIACPFIIEEIQHTLRIKFEMTPENIAWATAPIIEAISLVVEPDVAITGICRDVDDDNILACAVAAKATYLVTGDADLLKMAAFQGVIIVSPRDFESQFK